ncbi:MAG TPA: sigma-70 region 4 domain-containing protein [Thermomicrobiales bacterium]|nr:sigma-70 region 4 domain-containing protein [Thermomicrobiales bacterium]
MVQPDDLFFLRAAFSDQPEDWRQWRRELEDERADWLAAVAVQPGSGWYATVTLALDKLADQRRLYCAGYLLTRGLDILVDPPRLAPDYRERTTGLAFLCHIAASTQYHLLTLARARIWEAPACNTAASAEAAVGRYFDTLEILPRILVDRVRADQDLQDVSTAALRAAAAWVRTRLAIDRNERLARALESELNGVGDREGVLRRELPTALFLTLADEAWASPSRASVADLLREQRALVNSTAKEVEALRPRHQTWTGPESAASARMAEQEFEEREALTLAHEELSALIERANLSKQERAALELRQLDLKYSEIAARLKTSSDAVGVYLTRAHRKIKRAARAAG